MLFTYESRHVGDITVITCRGSLAEGKELAILQQHVGDWLRESAYIVTDLGAVDFIDSSGLGFLVRLHAKAQRAGGDLKLCALPARVAEVLRMTHLTSLFGVYGSEAEAIAACYQAGKPSQSPDTFHTDILCVDESPDALAYVRELLKRAGFGVLTATNIADAAVLSTTTRPKIVIISAALRSITGIHSFTRSNGEAGRPTVIDLPQDFSKDEAGHAARDLLARVQSAMAALG